ncbi:DUF3131 domain-containing protein [Mesorhizobium atlanticum]
MAGDPPPSLFGQASVACAQVGQDSGLGFASGIYSATGKPTAGYSDLNTNGMILEAVAFMLNGQKPLV